MFCIQSPQSRVSETTTIEVTTCKPRNIWNHHVGLVSYYYVMHLANPFSCFRPKKDASLPPYPISSIHLYILNWDALLVVIQMHKKSKAWVIWKWKIKKEYIVSVFLRFFHPHYFQRELGGKKPRGREHVRGHVTCSYKKLLIVWNNCFLQGIWWLKVQTLSPPFL